MDRVRPGRPRAGTRRHRPRDGRLGGAGRWRSRRGGATGEARRRDARCSPRSETTTRDAFAPSSRASASASRPCCATNPPGARCVVVDGGERTILTLGRRLHPTADDPLPWDELERGTVFFSAGDTGGSHARRARVLVATSRVTDRSWQPTCRSTRWSAAPTILPSALRPRRPHGTPDLVVRTEGAEAAGTRRATAAPARTSRPPRRVPSSTRTAPATPSRRGSRSRSAPAWRSRRRWRSPRDAEPGAPPGRTVREPAHRDRPLGERRDLHAVVFANVGRSGERRRAEHPVSVAQLLADLRELSSA